MRCRLSEDGKAAMTRAAKFLEYVIYAPWTEKSIYEYKN